MGTWSSTTRASGDYPIVISRYVFGDHENDESDALLTDIKGSHDAAVTGTGAITESAAGGGAANIVAHPEHPPAVEPLYARRLRPRPGFLLLRRMEGRFLRREHGRQI